MWIVQLALRRPYTFIVGALLVVIFGVLSLLRTPTDMFPEIDIPVVSVIWQYNGLSPQEMERRMTTVFERAVTTTVNDIEHIESQATRGLSVVKIFFHPGERIESAVAQIAALSQVIVRTMPPGTTAPFILRFNASNVPVLQLALSSETLSEQELQDLGSNGIRTRLASVQGASVPQPYGGRPRGYVARTLQTEIQLDNRDGRLLPGMFAQVKLDLPRSTRTLLIPANTLMVRPTGPQVAIVRDGKIVVTPVSLGRDFGAELEVLGGVSVEDALVVNPGDDVPHGATVRVARPASPADSAVTR